MLDWVALSVRSRRKPDSRTDTDYAVGTIRVQERTRRPSQHLNRFHVLRRYLTQGIVDPGGRYPNPVDEEDRLDIVTKSATSTENHGLIRITRHGEGSEGTRHLPRQYVHGAERNLDGTRTLGRFPDQEFRYHCINCRKEELNVSYRRCMELNLLDHAHSICRHDADGDTAKWRVSENERSVLVRDRRDIRADDRDCSGFDWFHGQVVEDHPSQCGPKVLRVQATTGRKKRS